MIEGMRWLEIGRVGRAHGLNGAFYVTGRSEPVPSSYEVVVIGHDPETSPRAEIIKSAMSHQRPFIQCSLAGNREEARSLVGRPIWVERSQVGVKARDEYLWDDLKGAVIVDVNGQRVGQIVDVYNSGASDVLEVKDDRGRVVGIPLVAAYLNMDFAPGDNQLHLTVPLDCFDGLWSRPSAESE